MFARFHEASQRYKAIFLSAIIAFTPTLLLTSNAYGQQRDNAYVYRPASRSLSDSELAPFADQLSAATESGTVPTSFDTADVSLKEALLIVGCDSPTDECMDRLAQTTSVQRTYYVIIEREQNLYRVNFNYYDLATHQFEKAERFIKRSDAAPQVFNDIALKFLSTTLKNTRLNLFTEAKNLDVRVEGRDFGSLPRSIETLVPDSYTVWIGRNGEQKWTDEITLSQDRPYTIKIVEDPITGKFSITKSEGVPGAPEASALVIDQKQKPKIHWGVWTLLGVGTVSVLSGSIFGVLVKRTENQANKLYRKYKDGQAAHLDAAQLKAISNQQSVINKKGHRYEALEFTMLGLGVAAFIGGFTWLTYDLIKEPDTVEASQTNAGLVGTPPDEEEARILQPRKGSTLQWGFSISPNSLQSTFVW